MSKMQIVRPDWSNEKAYSFTKDYSPSQWAWEFLRRQPEYQNSWTVFIESTMDDVDKTPFLKDYISRFSKNGGLVVAVQSALNSFKHTYSNSSDNDLICQYFRMQEIRKKSIYAANQWQLVDMLDPTYSLDSNVTFNTPLVRSESGAERTERLKLDRAILALLPKNESHDISGLIFDDPFLCEPYNLQLTVDMRIPIGVVKKQILKEIERQYTEAENLDFMRVGAVYRDDQYIKYLRTLDALYVGKNNDEIGDKLFPRQYSDDVAALRKQVSNTITQAKTTSENYWKIAHLENKTKK
jgi:hypothetical protein